MKENRELNICTQKKKYLTCFDCERRDWRWNETKCEACFWAQQEAHNLTHIHKYVRIYMYVWKRNIDSESSGRGVLLCRFGRRYVALECLGMPHTSWFTTLKCATFPIFPTIQYSPRTITNNALPPFMPRHATQQHIDSSAHTNTPDRGAQTIALQTSVTLFNTQHFSAIFYFYSRLFFCGFIIPYTYCIHTYVHIRLRVLHPCKKLCD